jgi:pimeloyl-ACP methyl ester carboxylesterase
MSHLLKICLFLSAITLNINTLAQEQKATYSEKSVSITLKDYTLYGTLSLPTQKAKNRKVALIVAGSGPTDRNGNNTMGLNCNVYKMLSEALLAKNIATLRFDKLGSGESRPANLKELAEKRDFEGEINDVMAWIDFLKKDKRFAEIILIGHSQGALLGILAAQRSGKIVSKFISLAGVGRKGNETIKEQLSQQPKFVSEAANPILDSLANGLFVKNVPPLLEVLFKPSMQPYLISWFKYDPADELAKLAIPSLAIQGTADIQIKVADAQYLVSKSKVSKLVIIERMNHVLKSLDADKITNTAENLATYSKPDLPLADELVLEIYHFLNVKSR